MNATQPTAIAMERNGISLRMAAVALISFSGAPVPAEDPSYDSADCAQRQADRVETCRHPEADPGADAHDEPQARETLLQSVHPHPLPSCKAGRALLRPALPSLPPSTVYDI